MGIYDRDYYRREGPTYLESLIPSGRICKWLIAINIAIFIVQIVGDRPAPDQPFLTHNPNEPRTAFSEYFDLNPVKVMSGQVWRLLTYAFLHGHGHLWQFFFSMFFLWMFGSELERMYGPREFLAFYLVAVFLGGLGGLCYFQFTHVDTASMGDSGAITALLLLFALHFPSQRVNLFKLVQVPIWVFVLFQVGFDTLKVPTGFGFDARAGMFHLAGALFGFLYFRQHWQILGLFQSLRSWGKNRARPQLRLYRPEVPERESVPVPAAAGTPRVLDEHLEAKLDEVLEKVARHGQGSLTDAERQILLRASAIYKRNRS